MAEPPASATGQSEKESQARARVIGRLVAAARPLFASRGPSAVSLREVAAAAGVNYGLIYQYVGTKDDLLRLVFQKSSEEYAEHFAQADGTEEAIAFLMRPKSSEYVRMLARSILEGHDPAAILGRSPALTELSRRIAEETGDSRVGGVDPRVQVAALACVGMGWGLFGSFVKGITGLDDLDDDELTLAVYAMARRGVFAETIDRDPPPDSAR